MTAEQIETLWRVVLFAAGAWVAGHHFLASNALTKAPHAVKLVLMPATVICGVGMCHAAWFNGSGAALIWCAPAVVTMSTTEFLVWRAGAYISSAFAKQAEFRERQSAAYNRFRADLTQPYDAVRDLLTESGMTELQQHDKKGWP